MLLRVRSISEYGSAVEVQRFRVQDRDGYERTFGTTPPDDKSDEGAVINDIYRIERSQPCIWKV